MRRGLLFAPGGHPAVTPAPFDREEWEELEMINFGTVGAPEKTKGDE
jgi:hypothetical protein